MNITIDSLPESALFGILRYLSPREIYNLSEVFPKNSSSMYYYLQRNRLIDKNGLLDFDELFLDTDFTNTEKVEPIFAANQIRNITRFPYNNCFLETPQSIKLTLNKGVEKEWEVGSEIFNIVIETYDYVNSIFLSVEDIRIFQKILNQEKQLYNIRTFEITCDQPKDFQEMADGIGKKFPNLIELRIKCKKYKFLEKNKKRTVVTSFIISRELRDVPSIDLVCVDSSAEPSPPSESYKSLNLFPFLENLTTFIIDYDFLYRFIDWPITYYPSRIGIILSNQSKIIDIQRLVRFIRYSNVEILELILRYSVKEGDLFPTYPECSTEFFSTFCSKKYLTKVILSVEIDSKKIFDWEFSEKANGEKNIIKLTEENCFQYSNFFEKIDQLFLEKGRRRCKIIVPICLSCKLITLLIKYLAKNIFHYRYICEGDYCSKNRNVLKKKIIEVWNIGKVFEYFRKRIKDGIFELRLENQCDFFFYIQRDSTFKLETVREIKMILEPQEKHYLTFCFCRMRPKLCNAFPNWTTFKIEESY